MGLWSEKLQPDPKNSKLKDAVSGVMESLEVVTWRSFPRHAELAEVYQNLTEPAETPFLGDERTWPTLPCLADLFSEVDRLYSTGLNQSFAKLNADWSGKVSSDIRYLIESALVIGKWTLEGPPKTVGRVIPNVVLFDGKRKQLTQFDGIIVRKDAKVKDLEAALSIGQKDPWWAIEVRKPNRARYISGPRKIRTVFQYDIAAYQHRLARILLDREGKFVLPACIVFAYLRGSLPDAIYPVKVGSDFIRGWRGFLQAKLDGSTLYSDQSESAKKVLEYLEGAEERAAQQEKKFKKGGKFKPGKLVQLGLF
jgi:hypothetical protein